MSDSLEIKYTPNDDDDGSDDDDDNDRSSQGPMLSFWKYFFF
jgi:hypothetical protein